MRKSVVLITGAAGEIGHGLIEALAEEGSARLVTLDLRPLEPELGAKVTEHFVGSILDDNLLERILTEYEVDVVFHLAAILSTRGELSPLAAHEVNVEGTLKMLAFARSESETHGRPVRFLYPSSIAAYGLPDLEAKRKAGKVKEDEWAQPITMYGCNKLYCEHLGRYFDRHFRQLAVESKPGRVDFRCLRFPGLISAFTVPSGGTSDYAPEMLHSAAKGEPYACFVRPDTRIPFMAMPDAVDALLKLAAAPREALSRHVYNVAAFNPSAGEFKDLVVEAFPNAEIEFEPDRRRQAIVDSWPEDVDDSAARRDWGFQPKYDLEHAFSDYLVPNIKKRYS